MTATHRPPGRPRGATADPAARREALAVAAEAAIVAHGPSVSMEQIAAAGGVSKATLYDNFDGKAGLTTALLDRYGRRVLEIFAGGLDQPMTASQLVRGGIEVFVRLIEDRPDVYRFILLHADGGEVLAGVAVPVAALIRSELADLEVDPSGADALAHATLGAVFTATEWWCRDRSMGRAAFVDLLVGFVWAGFGGAGLVARDQPVDVTAVAEAIDAAMALPPPSPR